jgi:cytochrome P450
MAMETSSLITPDQLMTPAVFADPYPVYRQLRDQTPLSYLIPPGTIPGLDEPIHAWALMKYDDVYGALRDHETFSSEDPRAGQFGPKLVLIQDDPPRHTRFRRLVNRAFTLKRVEALAPWIVGVANELLDEVEKGEVDVVQSYTIPLPVKVIARLLGIPGEDYVTFKRWSDAFLAAISMPPEQRAQNLMEMVGYFGQIAVARRTHGADDLITALVEAEIEGEALEDWEILGFCILLLIAGNETTTNLISNMLNILVDQPELWQQIREDRSLVGPIIEETLRYESPVQRLFRITTREVELSGVKIPQGADITIFYGAANRDPKAFPHPDEFQLDRDLRNHVAFGMGIHYCLGAPLARIETQISLNAFLDRFPVLKQGTASAIRQTASHLVFGFRQLPLVVSGR